MKVAMIFPPWTPREVYTGNLGLFVGGRWTPVGVLQATAAMREAGHQIIFVDGSVLTRAEMLAKLKAWGPELIGSYLTTFLWKYLLPLAADIKREMPGVPIMVGGPLASGWKGRCLEECADLDYVVIGEGEITGPELAFALERKQDLSTVLGIAYRDGDVIKTTPPRPPIMDLDSLPMPARDLIDIPKYIPPLGTYRRLPAIYLYTSRGCNGRCIFCWQLNTEGLYRARSAPKVLEEIDHCYKNYGIKEIRFFDDNLVYDQERIHAILDGIIERDYDLTFYGAARVDNITPEILRKMKKAKFWGIMFGVESGVQKNLDALNKGTTVEQNSQAVKWAHEAGLRTVTPIIFGVPGETYEDGLKTVQWCIDNDTDIVNFHALTPFPGAELYEHVEKYGTIPTTDFQDYSFEGCAFVPFTMTREEIEKLRQEAFRRFYRRPKYMLKRLLDIRDWTDFKVMAAGGIAFIITQLFNKEFTPHGSQV